MRVKKKDAQCSAGKVADRMPQGGHKRQRRGGWCECCERYYIGTTSEVNAISSYGTCCKTQ